MGGKLYVVYCTDTQRDYPRTKNSFNLFTRQLYLWTNQSEELRICDASTFNVPTNMVVYISGTNYV